MLLNALKLKSQISSSNQPWDERSKSFIQTAICVFVAYIGYGYSQERLVNIPNMKNHIWFVTLGQFFIYACLSAISLIVQINTRRYSRRQTGSISGGGITSFTKHFETIKNSGGKGRGSLSRLWSIIDVERRISLKVYVVLAFATLITIGCSNASLAYLNYPTQVIFKSCKLIPVMIGGIVIQNKRYTLFEFFTTMLMCAGLVIFTMSDSRVRPDFDIKGVLIIGLALLADAVIGNVQEKVMKKHFDINVERSLANLEVIFFSYSIAFFYLFIALLVNENQLMRSFAYFMEFNHQTKWAYLVMFSLFGYAGIHFVLTLVHNFDALSATVVTSLRKLVTICLSFMLFAKPFTWTYVLGGLLVLISILMNVMNKKRKDQAVSNNGRAKSPEIAFDDTTSETSSYVLMDNGVNSEVTVRLNDEKNDIE